MTTPAKIGTVISSTLRPEDLIPAIVNELKRLGIPEDDQALKDLIRDTEQPDYFERKQDPLGFLLSEDLECLANALDNLYAPIYCYFGAHPGDGADFGFWVQWEVVDAESTTDPSKGDEYPILKIKAGTKWPETKAHYILEVNDHGNATLYDRREKEVIWSVV